jgi:hypothetical protein
LFAEENWIGAATSEAESRAVRAGRRRIMAVEEMRRLAGLELNALRLTGVLPERPFEGARIAATATDVYDISGQLLYQRFVISKGRVRVAAADVAVRQELGGPLLAVSAGFEWDEKAMLAAAQSAARKVKSNLKWDEARFVAYSYPKLAVQFRKGGEEVLMLECWTWQAVPPAKKTTERKPLEPSNFERWSLLDELPAATKRANTRDLAKRLEFWKSPAFRKVDVSQIAIAKLKLVKVAIKLFDTRELHYSRRDSDHQVCYELRGQQTNVWCVGASTEMLLNFYRYEYDQVRLATELGLGTLAKPNGLSYSNVAQVVTVIEKLSSNNLDATMIVNPGFDFFRDQARANRPTISFIPGHSRTVAGYTRSVLLLLGQISFRGLLVYDPWPPNVGVITRWENFDTQTYQYGYSAVLRHV